MQFLFVSSLSLSSWTFLYYVLCKILLLKSRKSNRTGYFLHRVNLHLPGKVSCLSTGFTGSRNNPENCHYLVENIPTVEDINKEYLLLYPVWLLCWIWWVLACFKIATNHPSSYFEKSIFLWKLRDGPSNDERFLESFFVFEIVVEALPRLKFGAQSCGIQ